MRRWWWILFLPLLGGAAPVRDNTYIAGTTISPNDVMDNENPILTYLQNGVDTYAANSVTTAALQNNAVTSAKILDGTITSADLAFTINSTVLPAGAVFFMLIGSCPAWTTDVSATYANLFLRVNATAGTLSGGDTHTHTVGSYAAPSHTHSVSGSGWTAGTASQTLTEVSAGKAAETFERLASVTTSASGSGAITGTSASTSNVPSHVTAKLCQVN